DKDPARAFKLNERVAREYNHPHGYRGMAYQYYNGIGVPRDLTRAVECFRAGAELGDAYCMGCLANAYASGAGAPKEPQQQLQWLRRAAEAEDVMGFVYFGQYYLDQPDPQMRVEGVKWIRKAAERDDPVGMERLGYCYERGIGLHADPAEAYKWYR